MVQLYVSVVSINTPVFRIIRLKMDNQHLSLHIEDTPIDTEKTTDQTENGVLSLCWSRTGCLTIPTFFIWLNIQTIMFAVQSFLLAFSLIMTEDVLNSSFGISPVIISLLFVTFVIIGTFSLAAAYWITISFVATVFNWIVNGSSPDDSNISQWVCVWPDKTR